MVTWPTVEQPPIIKLVKMVYSIEATNLRTFLLFNVTYLISTIWFILSTRTLFWVRSQFAFDAGPSFAIAATLACIVIVLVIFISIFGFLACYLNSPRFYLAVSSLNSNNYNYELVTNFFLSRQTSTRS